MRLDKSYCLSISLYDSAYHGHDSLVMKCAMNSCQVKGEQGNAILAVLSQYKGI